MTKDEFLEIAKTILARPKWDFPPGAESARREYLTRLRDEVRDLEFGAVLDAVDRLGGNIARPAASSIAAVAGKRHEGTYRPIEKPKPEDRPDPEKLRAERERLFGPRGSLATPRESWRKLGARDETATEATDKPIQANHGAEKGDSGRAPTPASRSPTRRRR